MGRKRTSVEKVCQNCSKPYVVQAHRAEQTKFCSMACMYEGRPKPKRNEVTLICEGCQKPFVVPRYRKDTARFCSLRCGLIVRKPSFEEKRKAGVAAVVPPKQPKEVRAAKKKVNGEKYYSENKPVLQAKAKIYYEANKPLFRARRAEYEASKIRATPSWANFEKMEAFYLEADRLTQETGIPHDVDHFYPLHSKIMCGLHVETNLQVLTSSTNRKKSNSIPETDTPCLSPKMRLRTEKPTGPQMELPLTKRQRDKRKRRKKSFLKSRKNIPIS